MLKDKKIWSWALYDWANSAFATTVMAGFFPVFFKSYWSAGVDPLLTTARLGTTISIASLTVALLSPFLGAMADLNGYQKRFCLVFMLLGVIGASSMAFIPQGEWYVAMLVYGFSMMAFNATAVFYDSLLPSVANAKQMNMASSLGFSLGYLGGGVLFAINVAMFLKPETFGIRDGLQAVQISFLSVGLWWFVFSIPMAVFVKEKKSRSSRKKSLLFNIQHGIKSLRVTITEIWSQKNLAMFLLAYWLYIDGVYTVMTMAVDFGMSIGLESKDLISALLITQFVGFPSALFFGYISRFFGSRWPILVCIAVYILAVGFGTQMQQSWHFYALATVIGLVQGGVQGLSRSLYARMIPHQRSAEYFGLFNLVGKFASIAGPLVVALGVTVTQDPRMGMSFLIILFVMGGWLLMRVQEPAED